MNLGTNAPERPEPGCGFRRIGFALRLSVAPLTDQLVDILSISRHTYVFPEDISWCFNDTAEDDAIAGSTTARRKRTGAPISTSPAASIAGCTTTPTSRTGVGRRNEDGRLAPDLVS